MHLAPLFSIPKITFDTLGQFFTKEGQEIASDLLQIEDDFLISVFSTKKISEMRKLFDDSTENVEKKLLECGVSFTFNKEVAENIKGLIDNKNEIKNSLLVIECIFVSWVLISDQQEKIEFSKLVLDILNPFLFENSLNLSQKSTIYSSMYHVFHFIIEINAVKEFEMNMLSFLQLFQQNVSSDYVDLLASSLRMVIMDSPDELRPEDANILTVIHQIHSRDENFIPPKLLRSVFGSLSPLIYKLNISVLTFISSLSSKVSEDVVIVALSLLPSSLFNYILTYDKNELELGFGDFPEIEDTEKPPIVDLKFRFSDDNDDIFSLDSMMEIPDKQPIEKFLTPDLIARLGLISKIILAKDKYSSIFFSISAEQAKNYKEEMSPRVFMAFLYVAKSIASSKALLTFIIELHKSAFFDQRINFFMKNENTLVSSVRWATLERLGLQSTTYIFNVLEYLVKKPYIYAETILRLLQSQTYLEMQSKKEFIEIVTLHYSYFNSLNGEATSIAKSTIILLFSRLFLVPEYVQNFFVEEYYTTIFVSNIFNSTLKEFVIASISTYLMTVTELSKCLPSVLACVLQAAISSNNTKGVELCSELLKTVNNVMAVKKGIGSYLIGLRRDICQMLIEISKMNESDEILELVLQSMQFFIITSQIAETTSEEVSAFEAVSSIFKEGPPDVVFTKTIQLLAGHQLSSFAPIFFVREPKFLRFLLFEYAHTPKFEKALNYIQSLCSFSRQNILACHSGQLDMYLIDILQSQKENEDIDMKFVTNVLNLFTIIASYICSVPVVQRYISLFAPLSKTTISYLQPTYIKGLITTLLSAAKQPIGLFEIKKDGMIFEIKGIPCDLLNDGFTFATWVSIDSESSKYLPNILTLSDSQGQIISITMNVLDIYIKSKTKTRKSGGPLPEKLPLNKWILLTCVFKKDNEGIRVNASFNCGETFELVFPRFDFIGPVSCVVGGVESDGKDPENPLKMGSFAIFRSNDNYMISSIEAGGPQFNTPTVPHIFILKALSRNTVFTSSFISDVKSITLTTRGSPVPQLSTITDCLVNICGIGIIIPLFSQLDLVFPNGKKFDTCARLAIELLFTAISNNTEAQLSLSEGKSDSINIIAHLLTSADKSNITYNLYSYIFTLFQSLSSVALQTKVSKTILFNFDLWYHSKTIQDFRLVIRNWKRNLVPYLRSVNIPTLESSALLDTLEFFDFDDETRKLLGELVIEAAQHSFTQDDLYVLISRFITTSNTKVSCLILDIINYLAIIPNSPLLKVDRSCLINIIYITDYKDKLVMMKVIEVLISICTTPEISICPLCIAFDALLHRVKCSDANPDVFDFLYGKVKDGTYEGLSLLTWCAYALGEDYILKVFTELEPSKNFACHPSWALWPIIVSFNHVSLASKILFFLLKCSISQCGVIDSTIEMVGGVVGVDSTELRRSNFFIAIHICIKNRYDENYQPFFMSVLQFLFLHRNPVNQIFQNAVNNSPFKVDGFYENGTVLKRRRCLNPIDFYLFVRDYKLPTTLSFGIRIKEDVFWEDEGLACILLALFLEHKIPSLTSSMLFLSSLILSNELFAKEFVDNIICDTHLVNATDKQILNKNSPQRLLQIETLHKATDLFFKENSINNTKNLINFFNKTWKMAETIIDEVDTKILKISAKSIKNDRMQAMISKAECAKSWAFQWHALSTDRGIWAIVGDDDSTDLHWKKIPSPNRLTINWKFDNHLKASLMRETATNASTETINEIELKMVPKSPSHSFIFDTELPKRNEQKLPKSKYIGSFKCNLIGLTSKKQCILSLYKNGLSIDETKGMEIVIPSQFIKSIEPRKMDHKYTACEIFSWTGNSYFLNFNDLDQNKLLKKLLSVDMPNVISLLKYPDRDQLGKIIQKWESREITNYDYLLLLNQISGRSFNVLSQYPIFPWVIADYESEELDLSDIKTYRDLSCPPSTIQEGKGKDIFQEGSNWEFPSGVSTPGEIASYLVRAEPFTTIRIGMNGGIFDRSNCIFSSIQKEWENVSKDINDTRELIPEFFSMPEFLENENKFDLGTNEGETIDDVKLPPYAHGSAMEFIYQNRKALESDYVSENICKWIDLNFGYKQTGEEAINCYNKYRDEMYEDAYDKFNAQIVVACMENLGQVPHKIFSEPHPKRWLSLSDSMQLKIEKIRFKGINSPLCAFGNTVRNEKIISVLFNDRVLQYKIKRIMRMKSLAIINLKESNPSIKIDDITEKKTTELSVKPLQTKLNPTTKVCHCNSMFVVSNEEHQTIKFLGKSKEVSIPGSITSIAASGPIVCVGTGGATSNMFIGENLDELCTVQAFKSEVVCVAISSKYSIVASGTADGAVVISTLDNGALVRSIDLGSVPQKILITESFGFIAVFSSKLENGKTTYFISLYNVNGKFIRRREFDLRITAWNTYVSNHNGVDIIVFSDDSNRLFEFEAFMLDFKSYFYKCSGDVTGIDFIKKNILVICNNCLEFIEIN